ncbi:MAG: 16S rRNA (guanine(527)-N(7))-methyltransferase RsmG [Ktedonobacteraceae bacterium]
MSDTIDPSLTVFLEGVRQLGLALSDVQLEQFLTYRTELLDWNTRMNLTAITNPEEVLLKHFLDSLTLLPLIDKPRLRLLDIGTGAGFPGLPLKIVRPRWSVTLLEATGKKVTFVNHVIETLHLADAVAVHGRAEELSHKREYRAKFDVVTARAVAAIPTLMEYSAPYCRVGGLIIFPKKGGLTDELTQGKQAAKLIGAAFKAEKTLSLPGFPDERSLFVWEQRKLCPPQFPRSGAAMAKKPLYMVNQG